MNHSHSTPMSFSIQLDNKLQRLNTNDSLQEPIFSRQGSSTSVSTQSAVSPQVLPKSLSFTKINDDSNTPKRTSSALSLESLSLALTKVVSNNGQPRSVNNLTTTPANEPQVNEKWCIVLVGLPAAGKSSICKNLMLDLTSAFLNGEEGVDFKIDAFNAGNYRRKMSDFKSQAHDYFNFNNQKTRTQRDLFAHIALDHLLNSLINSQINVGIFDATNSTIERREYIFQTLKEKELKTGVKINTLILHVKCTDYNMWRFNVEGKTTGPDYINTDHDKSVADFVQRAELYSEAFQDISQEELKKYEGCVYIEIDNAGKEFIINENGFVNDDDLILREIERFVKEYKKEHGEDYLKKVDGFWRLHKINN